MIQCMNSLAERERLLEERQKKEIEYLCFEDKDMIKWYRKHKKENGI